MRAFFVFAVCLCEAFDVLKNKRPQAAGNICDFALAKTGFRRRESQNFLLTRYARRFFKAKFALTR